MVRTIEIQIFQEKICDHFENPLLKIEENKLCLDLDSKHLLLFLFG